MNTPQSQLTRARAAYHESGHLAAANAIGVPALAISLTPDAVSEARIHVGHIQQRTMQQCRDAMLFYVAGCVAERLMDPTTPAALTGVDCDNAWAAARKMHGLGMENLDQIEAEIAAAMQQAEAILRRHWVGVTAVAEALIHLHQTARRFGMEPESHELYVTRHLAAAAKDAPVTSGGDEGVSGPPAGGAPCGRAKGPNSVT